MSTFKKFCRDPYVLFLVFLALCGGGYGLGRVYFRATDGFGPEAISAPLVYRSEWDIEPLAAEKRSEVQAILDQRFYYFAKGTQSYVLQSEDGRFVLKFFKQKHLEPPLLACIGNHLPLVNKYASAVIERRREKKDRLFRACKLGYDCMAEDSGLVYLHFNPTDYLPRNFVFLDKLDQEHIIDLNKVAFYVQYKGIPLRKYFASFRDSKDLDGAKKALGELFAYLEDRSRKGVLDRDPNFGNNLGFIDGKPGNLDVGAIELDPLIKNPVEHSRRIFDHMDSFRRWLMFEYEELLSSYEKHLEALGLET